VEKYFIAGQATDEDTAQRVAYLIPKMKNSLSVYAIIFSFPLQQWMHVIASVLRYTLVRWSGFIKA